MFGKHDAPFILRLQQPARPDVKDEKTYLVTLDGDATKECKTSELVWLWRTAQIPDKAEYRDDLGAWRPLGELVKPIIEQEDATTRNALKHERKAIDPPPSKKPRWPWLIAGAAGVIVIVAAFVIRPTVVEKQEEMIPQVVQELKTVQEERPELSPHVEKIQIETKPIEVPAVVPGTTADQVREIWGEPKGVEWSSDPKQEMWRYKEYRVHFQSGIVTRLEPIR